jgi:hypothetical protein
MGAVLAAWMVEIGVQVWKGGKANSVPVWGASLPVPSIFLADMLLFGALAFGAKESSQFKTPAALLAWGFVVATVLNNPAAPSALANKLTGTKTSAAPATTTQGASTNG